ncbi:MAG: hypothetical protein WC044_08385 [Crocinitomicaceae bacterium]
MEKKLKYHLIICFVASLVISSSGCKKETFVHSNEPITPPDKCACCELGDSIVGVWVGHLIEREYTDANPTNPVYTTITDSMLTFTITRNYTGTFIDSIVCEFNIPYLFNDPIKLYDNTGYVPGNYSYHKFSYDANGVLTLFLSKTLTTSYPYYEPTIYSFSGHKL